MPTEITRLNLQNILNELVLKIGNIQIGTKKQFPYGWRKAAKGRTVWRILEEAITQNLEFYLEDLGFDTIQPAESEIGVYDFKLQLKGQNEFLYVNIKSSMKGGKSNSDDISKAKRLRDFYASNNDVDLFISTFQIEFNVDMSISICDCIVMPTAWIPKVYVNPSNGNLQSSKIKEISESIERTNISFITLLDEQIALKL